MMNFALLKVDAIGSANRLMAFLTVILLVAVSAIAFLTTADGPAQATAAPGVPSMTEAAVFEYFPSAYVNRATEVEAHIQAF